MIEIPIHYTNPHPLPHPDTYLFPITCSPYRPFRYPNPLAVTTTIHHWKENLIEVSRSVSIHLIIWSVTLVSLPDLAYILHGV